MPALEQVDGHEDGEQVHVRRVELEVHVCRAEVVAGRHHSDHEEGHPHRVEQGVGGACASARVGLTSFRSRKLLPQVEDSRPEAFISFDSDRFQFPPDGHVLLDVGDETEEEIAMAQALANETLLDKVLLCLYDAFFLKPADE